MIPLNIRLLCSFYTRLSPRGKIFFSVIATLSFLFLFERMLINPITSKMTELRQTTEAKTLQIRDDLAVLARRELILAEAAQYKYLLGAAKTEEEEETIFQKEIESLATENAIDILDMKTAGSHKEESAQRYFVNLNCEARPEELVSFMYHVENSDKMFSVDKLRVTAKRTPEAATLTECSMLISKLIVP